MTINDIPTIALAIYAASAVIVMLAVTQWQWPKDQITVGDAFIYVVIVFGPILNTILAVGMFREALAFIRKPLSRIWNYTLWERK